MVSNPPYGARLNAFDLEQLYHTITKLFTKHPQLHGGLITSYEQFETDEVS
jgi:23S rRNA G2445 N2-methylase RlmL